MKVNAQPWLRRRWHDAPQLHNLTLSSALLTAATAASSLQPAAAAGLPSFASSAGAIAASCSDALLASTPLYNQVGWGKRRRHRSPTRH